MDRFTKGILLFIFLGSALLLSMFVYILVDDAKQEQKPTACCSADTCLKYHHHE